MFFKEYHEELQNINKSLDRIATALENITTKPVVNNNNVGQSLDINSIMKNLKDKITYGKAD